MYDRLEKLRQPDFKVAVQLSKDPPTFQRDNLQWTMQPVLEDGFPYYLSRNDGLVPTDEDHAIVKKTIIFMFLPHYGPQQ